MTWNNQTPHSNTYSVPTTYQTLIHQPTTPSQNNRPTYHSILPPNPYYNVNTYINPYVMINQPLPVNREPSSNKKYPLNWSQNNSSRIKNFNPNNMQINHVYPYINKNEDRLLFITDLFKELQKFRTFSQYAIYLVGSQIVCHQLGFNSAYIKLKIFTFSQESDIKQINNIKNLILHKFKDKKIPSVNTFKRNATLKETAIIIDFLDGKTKLDITLYANTNTNANANYSKLRNQVIFDEQQTNNQPITIFKPIDQPTNWNMVVGISLRKCRNNRREIVKKYVDCHDSIKDFFKNKNLKILKLTSSLTVKDTEAFHASMASMINIIFLKLLPDILSTTLKINPNYPQDDFIKAWFRSFSLDIKTKQNNEMKNEDNKIKLDHLTSHKTNSGTEIVIDNSVFVLFQSIVQDNLLMQAVLYFIMNNFFYINKFEATFQQLFFPAITRYGISNVSTKQHTISQCLQQNKISDQQLSGALVIMLLCCKNSVSLDQFRNKIIPIIPNMTTKEKSIYLDIYDYYLQSFAKIQPSLDSNPINNQTTTKCIPTLFANNKHQQSHPDSELKEDQLNQQQTGSPTHNNMSHVNSDIKPSPRVNQPVKVKRKFCRFKLPIDNFSRLITIANFYKKIDSINDYINEHNTLLTFVVNLFWNLKQQGAFDQYAVYLFGTQIMCYTLGIPSKDTDMKIFTFSKQNSKKQQIKEIETMIVSMRDSKIGDIDSVKIFQRNSTIQGTAIVINFLDGSKLDITLYANCFKLYSSVIFKNQHTNNRPNGLFKGIIHPMNWNITVGVGNNMSIKYINHDANLEKFLQNKDRQPLRLTTSLKMKDTEAFHTGMAFMFKIIFLKLFRHILDIERKRQPHHSQNNFIKSWYRLFSLDIKTHQYNQVKNQCKRNKIKLNRDTQHKTINGCSVEIDSSVFNLFQSVVEYNFHTKAVFYMITQNFSYIRESEDILQYLFLHAITAWGVINIPTKNHSIAKFLQQNNISDTQLSAMLVIMLLCFKNSISTKQFRMKIVPIVPKISPQEILNYSDMYYCIFKKDYIQLTNLINTFSHHMQIHCYLLQLFINHNQPNPKTHNINNQAMIQCNSTLFAVNNNVNKPKPPINWEVKEDNQEAKQSQSTDYEPTGSQTATSI